MRRFRYEYGAGPLHLLSVLAALGITGYVALQVLGGAVGAPLSFLIWFVGAILLHDLVLFPLYSLVDRLPLRAAGVRRALPADEERLVLARDEGEWGVRPAATTRAATPVKAMVLNHLRVPAALAALMLLMWFPLILGFAEEAFRAASGMTTAGYLGRWLLMSGTMFGLSGLILAGRLARLRASAAARSPESGAAS